MGFDIDTFKRDFLKAIVKCYCEGSEIKKVEKGYESENITVKGVTGQSGLVNIQDFNTHQFVSKSFRTQMLEYSYGHSGDFSLSGMDNNVKIVEKKAIHSREEKHGIFRKTRIVKEEKNVYKLVLSEDTMNAIEQINDFLDEMNLIARVFLYDSSALEFKSNSGFSIKSNEYEEKFFATGPNYSEDYNSGIYEFSKDGNEIKAKDVNGNVLDKFTIWFCNKSFNDNCGYTVNKFVRKVFGIEPAPYTAELNDIFYYMQDLNSQIENL